MAEARGLRGWVRGHLPTRDTLHRYRLLRPFAKQLSQPNLWHLNHRSVPRGVALGLGIGVIIPFMHVVIAMIVAIPLRANVALAGAFTLVVNPLTIPPIYYAAYRIGAWELHHDSLVIDPARAEHASGELGRFLFWIHHASGPIALGILTISASAALLGYAVSAIGWRLWIRSKWRRRREERRAARI
ncbi:MAG: DUF2062 domain-containing protein [Alphaproteobacteria bacterium]|nr:DUF2062 domain-containing protein [Alphaproteobacteria bacterium]MBV9372483.1 DUF2062 domain-containing protein [Alphaproteobacteria bacterium]MBV9902158.1 DUF2062 domain-containing protein [Alphaproteobacteria bacterium]